MPSEEEFAFGRIALHRRASERSKADFLGSLGDDYPRPRGEQEWQAYKALRRCWKDEQIQQFVEAYGTEPVVFPGVLDTPGYPSLPEFQGYVGLLAGGKYARTLPRTEMLLLIAGKEAARGDPFVQGSRKSRTDALGKLIAQALSQLPANASSHDVLQKVYEIDGGQLIDDIDPDKEIFWRDARRARSTSFKSFQNRLTKARRCSHKNR
jgi:hypothetical protein